MLDVTAAVECILQRAGHVILYIRRIGTVIVRKHHDGVGLNVGQLVNGQLGVREQAEHHHCHKTERRKYWSFDRSFV